MGTLIVVMICVLIYILYIFCENSVLAVYTRTGNGVPYVVLFIGIRMAATRRYTLHSMLTSTVHRQIELFCLLDKVIKTI